MDATAELIKDLESLLGTWRNHVTRNPAGYVMTRDSGFNSALSTCAKQLAEYVDRYRANTED
jgi:hypothetical protein